MTVNQLFLSNFFLLFILALVFNNDVYSQDLAHPLSFESNQGNYKNSYGEYYYNIKKEEKKYRLTTEEGEDIFQETYDTIIKNKHFIKTVREGSISIYRIQNLEKIEIPNLEQVYFMRDGLEVLTNNGSKYYDNSIAKINNFPKTDFFTCGTVYSKQYRLNYDKVTKKHSIELSNGNFGGMRNETYLEFNGLPDNIESLSFLNDERYISKSVNSLYNAYPNLIKIVKGGKSGIYSYNLDDVIYPIKEKIKIKESTEAKEKPDYVIHKLTGDTIFVAKLEVYSEPILPIEPISMIKKGSVKLQQVLPIDYNQIQQNTHNGLIYLYKDKQIGIYPNHTSTSFVFFKEKTTSFYEIIKNGKQGWLDIKTFKEYYF